MFTSGTYSVKLFYFLPRLWFYNFNPPESTFTAAVYIGWDLKMLKSTVYSKFNFCSTAAAMVYNFYLI